MRLFDEYAQPGFHTCISTTFCIDFEAYERIALSRLRDSGCMNNLVIADSRMLTHALDDADRPPAHAGRRYSLVGAQTDKLFHPKLMLQLGPECARLIVASANLTASGIAGNLEVAGECRMDTIDDELVPTFRAAFDFVEQHVAQTEASARKQLQWARSHTPWLQRDMPAPADAPVQLITSSTDSGIAARWTNLVGGDPVRRLIIVSPYWDPGLAAVRYLQKQLHPRTTSLVIQPDRGLFPGLKSTKAQIFDIAPLLAPQDRFAHAKVIIAQTRRWDHVLFGSPNCTTSALGTATDADQNVEAALYKRMSRGDAIEALGLERVFEAGELRANQIAKFAPAKDIPLEEAAARQPGRFQLRGNLLTWIPATSYDRPGAVIELLDGKHQALQTVATVESAKGHVYTVETRQAPSFAKVHLGTRTSAPAVVQFEDEILQNLRVTKTKKIEDGLAKLAAADLEGLFLYEALELIDVEEHRMSAGQARLRQPRHRPGAPAAPAKKLTYEEFIRARAPGTAPDLQPTNSLATSYANEVRAALNALLGIDEARLEAIDAEVETDALTLDTGDDTADGDDAIESGAEPDAKDAARKRKEGIGAAPAQSVVDTEEAIATAVHRFNEQLAAAARSRSLTNRDLLRVRVLLTVVLCSGTTRTVRRAATSGERPPILLSRGERGWARLASQIILCVFGGAPPDTPLIHRVEFDVQEGQRVPVDILECLATCFWAIGALTLARDERGMPTEVQKRAQQRAAQMYGMTILESEDLVGDVVVKVMRTMSSRYSARLGVSDTDLVQFHASMSGAAAQLRAQWLARA